MLGMSKSFVIFLFISFIFGYELGWIIGVNIMISYIIFRVIWKLLT
jgi:hypothetical protein